MFSLLINNGSKRPGFSKCGCKEQSLTFLLFGLFLLGSLEKHLESKHSHRGGNEHIPHFSAGALLPTRSLKVVFWSQRCCFFVGNLRSAGLTFGTAEPGRRKKQHRENEATLQGLLVRNVQ